MVSGEVGKCRVRSRVGRFERVERGFGGSKGRGEFLGLSDEWDRGLGHKVGYEGGGCVSGVRQEVSEVEGWGQSDYRV